MWPIRRTLAGKEYSVTSCLLLLGDQVWTVRNRAMRSRLGGNRIAICVEALSFRHDEVRFCFSLDDCSRTCPSKSCGAAAPPSCLSCGGPMGRSSVPPLPYIALRQPEGHVAGVDKHVALSQVDGRRTCAQLMEENLMRVCFSCRPTLVTKAERPQATAETRWEREEKEKEEWRTGKRMMDTKRKGLVSLSAAAVCAG